METFADNVPKKDRVFIERIVSEIEPLIPKLKQAQFDDEHGELVDVWSDIDDESDRILREVCSFYDVPDKKFQTRVWQNQG